MIRVALIGDSHFDEGSRFQECVDIHDWMAEEIRRCGANIVLHSGDVFERKSTPAERAAVAAWLTKLADHCPVVVVRGNHDALNDLSIFSRLRTRYPLIVEEGAAVHKVEAWASGMRGATSPGTLAIGCLAWPRKAELLASTGAIGQDAQQLAQEALRSVLRGLGAEMADHDGPRILLAHALVTGSMTSTGQPLVGHELELDLSDLALAGADLYALGHIHKAQDWAINGAPVVYPGSPRRTSFGETERKGFIVADFDETREGWRCVSWSNVETPARQMILAQARWDRARRELVLSDESELLLHGTYDDAGHPIARDAEIRLRYEVESEERDPARTAANACRDYWLKLGAHSFKVEEEVRANKRAKAPEVATAKSLGDKLQAYWASRGTPEPERRQSLLSKLSIIEEEARRAS
jgi:exonuclease SbcD